MLADELGENGPASLIFAQRAQDVFLGARLAVDAEEFGEKVIGCAVVGRDAHEGEIGDILHWRQGGERLARSETWGQGGAAGKRLLHWSPSSLGSSFCCFSTRSRISVMSSTTSKTLRATKMGRFCCSAKTMESLGRASSSRILRPSSFCM